MKPIISGSWIDVVHPGSRDGVYWNRKTLAYTEAEWRTLVQHLAQDLGIKLLIMQGVVKDGLAIYPSSFLLQEPAEKRWYTRNCHDPLGAIIRACGEFGVDFYMGIGFYPGEVGLSMHRDDKALGWYRSLSEEVLRMYGAERAFKGWYMAAEMAVVKGAYQPCQMALATALCAIWHDLRPGWPTMASPYFQGSNAQLLNSDQNVELLAASGLSVVAYQDGIGTATAVQMPATPDPARNARVFAETRAVHARTQVELWANVESFCFENEIFAQPLVPACFERLCAQMENAAPHVDRIVSYTVPGLMTSQTVCPDLGVPETERLYQDYRRYLKAG